MSDGLLRIRQRPLARLSGASRYLGALLVLLAGASVEAGCQKNGGSNCDAGTSGCQCRDDGSCDDGLRCARASQICQPGATGVDASGAGGTGASGSSDSSGSGGDANSSSAGGDAGSGGQVHFAAGGTSNDGGMCNNVVCNGPPCCEDACSSNSDCCEGTICSADGHCIPENCSRCGELGCLVDFAACAAQCARPGCCLDSCESDDDCCPGAICSTQGSCIPDGCSFCSGMRSFCAPSDKCDFECVPPPSCGDPCSDDADCGTGSQCNQFNDGTQLCVPDAFQEQCDACGSGCSFSPSECDVSCRDAAATGTGGSGGSGSTSGSGGSGGDASGGGSGGLMGSGGSSATSECSDCCAPCTRDADCCSGRCRAEADGGDLICMPAECAACDHGCSFTCPN